MKTLINSTSNILSSPEMKSFLDVLDFTVERDALLAEHKWTSFEEREDFIHIFTPSLPLRVEYDSSVAKSTAATTNQEIRIKSKVANRDKVPLQDGSNIIALSAGDIVCTCSFAVESEKGLMQWIDQKKTIDPQINHLIDEDMIRVLLPKLSTHRSLITDDELGQYSIENSRIATYLYSSSFDFSVEHIRARYDMVIFIGWSADSETQPAIFTLPGGVAQYTGQSKDEYLIDFAARFETLPSTILEFIEDNIPLPEHTTESDPSIIEDNIPD